MRKLSIAVVLAASVAHANPKTRAKLSFGPPVVTGTLDAKAVTPVIERARTQLLACYKKQLAKAKADEIFVGQVRVSFTIGAGGNVVSATANGFDNAVETCVAQVIGKLRFAKKRGESTTEVTYPLDFEDANIIYGGLLGSDAGEMLGGFGGSGFGLGGGGTGEGTIGLGTYGTIGGHGGTGSGYGVGRGRGGMRGRAAVPQLSIGTPTTSGPGELDKAIIRRYIKRNFQKLLYCFEKELLAKPSLAGGSMMTELTIGKTGAVTAAKASGVDTNVDACVEALLARIEFPKPKNDGEVNVRYPLLFRNPKPAVDQRSSTPSPRK